MPAAFSQGRTLGVSHLHESLPLESGATPQRLRVPESFAALAAGAQKTPTGVTPGEPPPRDDRLLREPSQDSDYFCKVI
jgi:hypothetical protein